MCGNARGGEKVKADEIEETMQLINEKIRKKCDQNGDSAREIYLLSLALKEMGRLAVSIPEWQRY